MQRLLLVFLTAVIVAGCDSSTPNETPELEAPALSGSFLCIYNQYGDRLTTLTLDLQEENGTVVGSGVYFDRYPPFPATADPIAVEGTYDYPELVLDLSSPGAEEWIEYTEMSGTLSPEGDTLRIVGPAPGQVREYVLIRQ